MTTNKFRDKMIDKNLKHLMLKMLPWVIFKWEKNEMKITFSPFPVNIMFFYKIEQIGELQFIKEVHLVLPTVEHLS